MNSIEGSIFGLVAGGGFILLGRWIYVNPGKALYVSSVHSNPNSRFLKLGAKIIGTFIIFLGSCATVTAALGSLVNPNSTAWLIVPIVAGVLGGWFLRPRIVEAPRIVFGPPAAKPGGLLTSRGRHLVVWAFGGGALLTAAFVVLLRTGEGHLIPVVVMILTLVMVVALAAILWF